jgi:hypothetical protein
MDSTSMKTENSNNVKQRNVEWKFPLIFRYWWCIQFFGWLQAAVVALYFSTYVAVDIYKGNTSAKKDSIEYNKFIDGVRNGVYIQLVGGISAAIFSVILPYINKYIGYEITFYIGELGLSIVLFLFKVLPISISSLYWVYIIYN